MNKISTGIAGIDSMLGRGIEENSVVLVSGASGTGKTILALQYLIQGLSVGSNVLYITFKESTDSLVETIKTMGLGTPDFEKKFEILEISPDEIPQLVDSEYKRIEDTISEYKPKRIVVDSISTLSLYYEGLTLKQNIFQLYNIIRKSESTALLISDVDRRHHEESDHEFIDPYVDGIIALYSLIRGEGRFRAIEILKMRRSDHHINRIWYKIKDGFEVDYKPNTTIW